MYLFDNPFYILNATPRDDRRRITELAEERSLLLDSDKCMQARSDLTNPRKRLAAEIAWLPGVWPKQIEKILTCVGEVVSSDIIGMDKLMPLARANSLAAVLPRLPRYTSNDVAKRILEIAWAFEAADPQALRAVINEERKVSGFPEVTDLSSVEEEIQQQQRHYRQAINSALDNLSAEERVKAVTVAVESATDKGEKHGPILIDKLVESYEIKAKAVLEKEEEKIKRLARKIRATADAQRPDSTLSPMVSELMQTVKNWDLVAQPIQVSTKSLGRQHDASRRVAGLVRELSVHLWNEHRKLDFSRQLATMLQDVFAEVVELAERHDEDKKALDNLERRHEPPLRPRDGTAGTAERQAKEKVEAMSVGSGGRWVLFAMGIGIVFLIWLINNIPEIPKPRGPRYDQPPSGTKNILSRGKDTMPPANQGLPYYPPDAEIPEPSDLRYDQPPSGINNMLSIAQMRWCTRESIRISVIENIIATQKSRDELQKISGDYKDRCHNKRRSENDAWRQAYNEVMSNRDQIESVALLNWIASY